uniref:Terpene synthase 7 n=1 Tax=Scutellaria barbata TaxID=396367 RepID=A0A6B7LI86_9LAMI|nr:terpene synthase 7 [Scutellaria barbata]
MEMVSYHGTIEEQVLLKHSEKIEQIRDVMVKVEQGSLESLLVVDSIQRLGLGYLFEEEIKALLHHHYLASKSAIFNHRDDLHKASLGFRLLRQQGFSVSPDEFFRGFKGEDGELKLGETKGVMAMYEASHLSMEGEDILHEAARFSAHYLINAISKGEEDEEEGIMVKNCLFYPQHKTLPSFRAEKFLQSMNGENRWENLLREAAHLEFAILHSHHKREILQVVEWWQGVGLRDEMKSMRDQPGKWHMWSTATLWGPTWSQHRTLLTKPISLVYAVDDIFDLHATIHQLILFTQAVNRWEISAAEELPSYMKTCLMAIYDTTYEISRMVSQEYGWNPIDFLKKEWGKLMDAFLKEAKWLKSGEMGKADEYLKNGMISSGEEKQEGYDGSYVECYMKEEEVDSIEAAREHVMGMVSDTWQDLNIQALSSTSPFSAPFRHACLNAARMVPTMYNYHNTHGLHRLQHHRKSM